MGNAGLNRIINVKHMIWSICSHYRSLILLIAIGIVLGLGIGLLQNSTTGNEASHVEIKDNNTVLELSESTLVNMQMAYDYNEMRLDIMEYIDKSQMHNLDTLNMYCGTISYVITDSDSEAYVVPKLVQIFDDDEKVNAVAEGIESSVEPQYVRELLHTDIKNVDENSSYVTWKIILQNSEDVRSALANIRNIVEKTIEEDGLDVDAIGYFMDENVSNYMDREILLAQLEMLEKLYDSQMRYTSKTSTFNSEEMAYFVENYLGGEKIDLTENQNNYSDLKINYFQYAFIGGVLFGILWVVYWGITYILGKKVKDVSDIASIYDGYICGVEPDYISYKSNKLDQYIYKKESIASGLVVSKEYATNEIVLWCADNKKVICGANSSNELCSNIINACTQITSCEHLISDNIDTLKTVKHVGHEILVVNLNKTRFSAVVEEVSMAKKHSIVIDEIVCML